MTTNNHPAHGPVSLERLHQISEILSKASAQSDGGNLGYAMADAVKVIDGAIAAFDAEPVGTFRKGPCGYYPSFHEDAVPLYTAPPAQLVNTIDETLIEALRLVQCMLDDYRERNYGHAQEWIRHISAKMDDYSEQHGDDAYSVISAAMLQAGNHTEQHLDMVVHSGDDNEKADCRLPFDQWLSQQNEPIDVDCGCVTTEAFYHWLRVAYEAGSSPVTPDGWVACSERMPEGMTDVHISNGHDVGQGWWDGDTWQTQHDYYSVPGDVTHWLSLPAAPQQEVKSALEHGMRRYAGAMQKLSEGDD
ncbi:DUF551 domain-containing protein [Citrobacter portucalensis]|uniref:DUF551 domain-containing protein n=1 Tax=Citrobacter portucalensis TaxID=1639133 RepID=UPI00201A2204|nr:DUF551 domain-containing protein [Citrobacter portucalensis]UQQ19914.1 DUF551 domain-containing protein [Citrobacter portucalensis]